MNYTKTTGLPKDARIIREKVFIEEQNFKNEFDEIDKEACHLVFYDNQMPVATARFYKINDEYHIGRIAVIKEFRKKHLGSFILKTIENEIKKEGGNRISLLAQVRVCDFYKKNGYKQIGTPYYDEYCEHITMEKII